LNEWIAKEKFNAIFTITPLPAPTFSTDLLKVFFTGMVE